jgi:hypothetical protein
MAVARSEPASVVQKAERELAEPVFACAVPVLLQASAERLLEARELLEPELNALRAAMDAQLSAPCGNGRGGAKAELLAAAGAYTRAFERHRDLLTACDEDDELRVIDGTVAISGVTLPVDAVLTSSLAAMRVISPVAARPAAPSGDPARPVGNGCAGQPQSAALGPQRVLTLIVKVLGRSPASRR